MNAHLKMSLPVFRNTRPLMNFLLLCSTLPGQKHVETLPPRAAQTFPPRTINTGSVCLLSFTVCVNAIFKCQGARLNQYFQMHMFGDSHGSVCSNCVPWKINTRGYQHEELVNMRFLPMKKVSGPPSPNRDTVFGSSLSQSPTANTSEPISCQKERENVSLQHIHQQQNLKNLKVQSFWHHSYLHPKLAKYECEFPIHFLCKM